MSETLIFIDISGYKKPSKYWDSQGDVGSNAKHSVSEGASNGKNYYITTIRF